MSLICTQVPETPYKCDREGTVSQTVNFSIRFHINVHPKLKIGIRWKREDENCDGRSNCDVTWSEEGVTNAWQYIPFTEDVAKANELISASVAEIQENIYKQNKGNKEFSQSDYSSWITTECSGEGQCTGYGCTATTGGSPNKNCRQLEKGQIFFNCKTADFFEVTNIQPTSYEPKNAVNNILKSVADMATDMEQGTKFDLIYDPIKPGDKTHLEKKIPGESNCGPDCARKWQWTGGTSDEGVRVLETPNPKRTDRTLTRSGSVKITTRYFYCQ